MNQVELAQRIKNLRLERRLTLDEASARAGLTRSWWSKIENFRLTPSLPALFKIAAVLGVSTSELLVGLDERPPMIIVRPADRQRVDRDPEISSITYDSLAHGRPNRRMDPFVLTLNPGARRSESLPHEGEEFMFVIDGRLVFIYGDQPHELSAGDAVYFDAGVAHRLENPHETMAQVLCVFESDRSDAPINE